MKNITRIILAVALVLGTSTSVFAGNEDLSDISSIGIPEIENEAAIQIEPRVGRFYIVVEEVVSDRKSNEYLYQWGMTPAKALRRAYVYSEYHYQEIEHKVGDDSYRRFVRDKYDTTWKGQTRATTSSSWKDHPNYPKKHEITSA